MSSMGASFSNDADLVPEKPAYLRIADALRELIESGELVAHDSLPPERDLCVTHQVSRMTARRALTVLESEGLVHRDKTRGTFVSEPRVRLRLGSFSEEVIRTGGQPGADLIWAETQEAGTKLSRLLDVAPESSIFALQRLRRSNGEPLALETTFYPAADMPGLLEGDLSGSLWAELHARYNIRPATTTARVEVVALDTPTAERLEARPASAGLHLTRRTFDEDGRCIEYAQDVYRADRVSLIIERTVG